MADPTSQSAAVTEQQFVQQMGRGSGLTREQETALAADALARGAIGQAEYDRIARTGAVDPEAAKNDEALAVLQHHPAANPEQYNLPRFENYDDPGAQEFDRKARSWLASGGFPRAEGSAVAQSVDQFANTWQTLSEPQRELLKQDNTSQLMRIWKGDYQANLSLADKMVQFIEKQTPGLIEYLEVSGAGNDAMTIAQFHAQAVRHLARGGTL